MKDDDRIRDGESWKEIARMVGWMVFIGLFIWVMHIKLFAERARAHTPHPPMLLCDVGC